MRLIRERRSREEMVDSNELERFSMNRVVRHHYPVEQLPEELRAGMASTKVTVVVTEERPDGAHGRYSYEQLLAIRDKLPIADDDPAERIRALRDEWD